MGYGANTVSGDDDDGDDGRDDALISVAIRELCNQLQTIHAFWQMISGLTPSRI
jgi:hypothetical protein